MWLQVRCQNIWHHPCGGAQIWKIKLIKKVRVIHADNTQRIREAEPFFNGE